MGALKNPNVISVLFKFVFLFINLITGVLLARSLSLPERGIGGLVFSLVSILSVWQSLHLNEKLFRDKESQSTIEFNAWEQILYFGLILAVSKSADAEILFPLLYFLLILSAMNSRLLAITYVRRGLIIDRFLQLFHLSALLIGMVILEFLESLSLSSWVTLTLLVELMFGSILYLLNSPNEVQFRLKFDPKSLLKLFRMENFLLISENLSDRYLIFVVFLIFSSDDLALFVVAISFVLIVGLPATASYPYPVANAKLIKFQLINLNYQKKFIFIILGFAYLVSCFLGVTHLTHLIYGDKYLEIEDFALGIVFAGAGTGMMKYFSAVWRGLGYGSLGNILQLISLCATSFLIISAKVLLSSSLSILIIFLVWGLFNFLTSIILIRRILNDAI